MKTNTNTDIKLLKKVLEATGLETKKKIVDEVLQNVKEQSKLKFLKGKLHLEGNIDKMRTDK